MSINERDVLDILHEMLESEQSFFRSLRFIDHTSRSHMIVGHMRNHSQMLAILRAYMLSSPTTSMVLNIPLGALDASGNFFDAVPVIPSAQEIRDATETNIQVHDATCSICQDNLTNATRIRYCGHTFHADCISQWFSMNTRCPVCRHDIRSLRVTRQQQDNENSSMHANTQ